MENNQADEVGRMAALYRDKLSRYGEEFVRDDLAMARMSASRMRDPQESHDALKLYQETEKAVFGSIGKMNRGEKDLTVEGEQGATQ